MELSQFDGTGTIVFKELSQLTIGTISEIVTISIQIVTISLVIGIISFKNNCHNSLGIVTILLKWHNSLQIVTIWKQIVTILLKRLS